MRTPRRRRALALTAAVVGASMLLAGCSGAKPGSSTGDATAWPVTGGVHEQLWQHSFDTWNEANPSAKIDAEFFANDAYKERIRTAIGAGTNPTLIFSWAGGTLDEYVANGNVIDLTERTANVVGRVLPSVAQAGMVDGKVYAVPNGQSQPIMLYYNTELFDQVGAKAPTTWSELMDAVRKFNAAGIAPFSVAGQSRWPYLMWIEYLVDRIGGPEVFQAVLDGKKDAWSDPAITTALSDIQELVKAGGFGQGYGSVSADANADLALVYTGRAAMVLQGSWVYSTFKADAADMVAAGKIGTTTFPTVEGGKGNPANIVGNPSNYWSVAANASPEQVAAATSYLDQAVFDDDYTTFLLENGGVPPVAGIEDQLAAQPDAKFLTLAYGMVRDAPSFQLSWDQALPPAQAQALLTNLEQIFLLQITPEQFSTNMNATIAG